ncbi:septum formation protein Maf [Pontibacillus halophilus JSM 076056 = DSM 19796]|uniref:dTTP/UTP pyrophosphatase n=1 Tax=Pontibacillus halophilus JSM 076056 = DSM 19796 TaxID=1385510 RepID=A0A0A5GNE0_9BACI|nr:Maf family protein [Pontibacillus halophilus]KGX93479.1 septum formation protein Maf [Pontibacillus halophilus JSM 076056 = DSM 19796]
MKQLILASSSIRRKELLQQAQLSFDVQPHPVDEAKVRAKNPHDLVHQLAELKGRALHLENDDQVVISADTVVYADGEVLGKPSTKREAYDMLLKLSGGTHEVYTGVMLRSTEQEQFIVEKTTVEFWPLTKEDIEFYIETGDPFDKAGGYGIQTAGAVLVKGIKGDYNNVVGLPLARVVRALRSFDIYPSLPLASV